MVQANMVRSEICCTKLDHRRVNVPRMSCGQTPSTNIRAMLGSTRNRSAVVRSGNCAQRSFSGPQNTRWMSVSRKIAVTSRPMVETPPPMARAETRP